jgi:hypothetical protein
MIIDDFDLLSAGFRPSETHSKLIVDPNAVQSLSIPFEPLQTIPRWNAKVIQPPCDLQLAKLATCHRSYFAKTLYRNPLGQSLRIGTPKAFYHQTIITCRVINVKRF